MQHRPGSSEMPCAAGAVNSVCEDVGLEVGTYGQTGVQCAPMLATQVMYVVHLQPYA